jgi:hypothetical protein
MTCPAVVAAVHCCCQVLQQQLELHCQAALLLLLLHLPHECYCRQQHRC